MVTQRRFGKCAALALLGAVASTVPAWGAIAVTGDGVPFNSGTWTTTATVNIGNALPGSVVVNGASGVSSGSLMIGSTGPGVGSLTITGAGSIWSGSNLYLQVGMGVVNITNGGKLSDYIGEVTGGTITVDGAG